MEFHDLTEGAKRKRTAELRKNHSSEVLMHAAAMSSRSEGNIDASHLITETLRTTEKASKIRKAWIETQNENKKHEKLNEDEALSLITEAKLTKAQYLLVRSMLLSKHVDILPSYDNVILAKKRCYPEQNSVKISEKGVVVDLQSLLNKTTERIITLQEEVLGTLTPSQCNNLTLICKWGFDGASGQASYNLKTNDPDLDDRATFMTSLVPLQMYTFSENSQQKIIVWQNPRPSSPRFYRPLQFSFEKETAALTVKMKNDFENQIKSLLKYELSIAEHLYRIKYVLRLTMLDGKACNHITGTKSTQRCNICNILQSQMNNLTEVAKMRPISLSLEYGISSLHMWMRIFECLLHIAYKSEIETNRAKSQEQKEAVAKRKKLIQQNFKEKMHLKVDVVVQGSGISNTGNTARTLFKNLELSAEITGLDVTLVKRLSIILHAISSGYEINLNTFREYTQKTAEEYLRLYKNYPMTPSLHKLLIHGPDIIEALPLPIGNFSEEAQEARNKDFRWYREHNTRKMSRVECNEDLFHMLIITSDPLISSMRQLPFRKADPFSEEVLSLLQEPCQSSVVFIEDDSDE